MKVGGCLITAGDIHQRVLAWPRNRHRVENDARDLEGGDDGAHLESAGGAGADLGVDFERVGEQRGIRGGAALTTRA